MVRLTPSKQFDFAATITDTYFALRIGLAAMAAALPLILWWGGKLVYDLPLQVSMSAYYLTPMRNWFVGILFAAAACLYVYKGLSDREDWLLNIAAVFAVLIAVNPVDWQPSFLPDGIRPHDLAAFGFFGMITLACWLCQRDSIDLNLIPPEDQRMYRAKYAVLGVLLVALPAVAIALRHQLSDYTFWAELASIWTFAYYWFTKSGELKQLLEREVKQHGLQS